MTDTKIWTNSGDSHVIEPDDLWRENVPAKFKDLMPHAVKDDDGEWETVHVDGKSFRRKLPGKAQLEFMSSSMRAPGAFDLQQAHGRPRPGGRVGRGRLPVARPLERVVHHP